MEPVSTLIPRTLNNVRSGIARPRVFTKPNTLPELVQRLEAIESEENPDIIVPTDTLTMGPCGFVHVPALKSEFALTDWSRGQLASLLGIRWSKYAEDASEEDLASEVTRRMQRATGEIRIRSTSALPDNTVADGTIRAFVAPGYSPVSDTRATKILAELLAHEDVSVRRLDVTPMTTSFMLDIGKPINPRTGSQVGDVRASVLFRNSGTGWASFFSSLALTRLACLNGLVVRDGSSIRRAHRGLDEVRIRSVLTSVVSNIGPRVREAADRLLRSTEHLLDEPVQVVIERLIANAKLPKKILPEILDAFLAEPHASRFGVSQALTLGAQQMTPELRIQIETLAGDYIAEKN